MSNTFDKLSVLDSFIEEVNSYLPEIEANLERLTQSPGDMEALEETYRRTHTIGGSASMMDFPGLAHVAHGMEDILGDVLDGLATLDRPTVELLQRSLARLYRLVGGIHQGVDESAVVAEDDDDYARYRIQQDGAAQEVSGEMITPESVNHSTDTLPDSGSPAISSLDEMLASFRTVPQSKSGEAPWSEEPVMRAEFPPRPEIHLPVPPMQPAQHAQFEASASSPETTQPQPPPSALEMLAGRGGSRTQPVPPSVPNADPRPVFPSPGTVPSTPRPEPVEEVYISSPTAPIPVQSQLTPLPLVDAAEPLVLQEVPTQVQPEQLAPASADELSAPEDELSGNSQKNVMRGVVLSNSSIGMVRSSEVTPSQKLMHDMEGEARSLEDQAASLKRTLSQLRLAASVIEGQRTEFKGFLDGSRDALDRMEDWAGKAMGLNLRNSPEQVRRYLPLSVMWVANSKLKKILDMLLQMTTGVENTEDQVQLILQQLHTSIISCGDVFLGLQNAPESGQMDMSSQVPGWTPWDMKMSSDPERVHERVTFERHGDLAALRLELESQIRQDVQEEYEKRSTTLAARAEIEHQIREEVRAEFAAKQALQASFVAGDASESLQDMEIRLRNEIEIQVRREFLTQLADAQSSNSNPTSFSTPSSRTNESNSLRTGTSEGTFVREQNPVSSTTRPPVPDSVASSKRNAVVTNDFGEEAAEIFRLEADEHLQTISIYVAEIEHSPKDLEPIQGIRRATHTLKGAAGMMGFRLIADLCHISEDMLDEVMEGTIPISSTVLSLILDTAEALDVLINGKNPAAGESAVQSLRGRYGELLGERLSHAGELEYEPDDEAELEHSSVTGVVSNDAHSMERTLAGGARADLSVRVSLSKLDELVNLFGELLVNRTILEERIQRLNSLVVDTGVSSARLRDVGQRLESRFEAATLPSGRSVQVMPGEGKQNPLNGNAGNRGERLEPAHVAEFDELELDRYTEFHQLARGLSEGISDMTTLSTEMEGVIRDCEGVFGRESRLSTTFQDRLMKARLVPLSTMIPRLYRTARAVALKQHKEFELVLDGQETEVDRTVIEEIAGPLLHLIRNAVNHALEVPEVRVRQGKTPEGHIRLSAAYEGNLVVITVRDDGTGIDPERIRSEAIHRGLIHPRQVLSDNEIIELIFRPGFSTAEVLSEESGRGVGLDVVRDSVSRLRGTLEVESMPGQGMAFTMKFPTSLAIQNAMMVQVADQRFAIPTVMVEAIGRLDNFKRTNYGGRPAILVQNQAYPLSGLAQLLGLPVSELNDKAPLLLVRTDRHRVALVVDDIKGRLDVVIKNLGPHLRNVHGVAGGTVLGNGRVILILELLELLSAPNSGRGALAIQAAPAESSLLDTGKTRAAVQIERRTTIAPQSLTKNPSSPVAPQGKYILVVDDSPSVRRVVGNMLKQHNWEVQTARDGVEALEIISKETPAAVLLDIEMPRMDGYELMATVRAQEQYRTLPLVMLTSRAASKHQQRAIQLGANAYVVKPYQDEELIEILNSLVYGASVA